MKQVQRGFTLIELVMVIVILGILAAVALPKFVDLSDKAGDAATMGVAGSISSASAINYAAKMAGASATDITGTSGAVCVQGKMELLVTGITFQTGSSVPSNSNTYSIGPTAASSTACTAGGAVPCSLLGSKGTAQTAQVICTGA